MERNQDLPAINEIRTARETPPLLALRGQKKARSASGLLVYGGDGEDRTPDLLIANQALSQLSYAPRACDITDIVGGREDMTAREIVRLAVVQRANL